MLVKSIVNVRKVDHITMYFNPSTTLVVLWVEDEDGEKYRFERSDIKSINVGFDSISIMRRDGVSINYIGIDYSDMLTVKKVIDAWHL